MIVHRGFHDELLQAFGMAAALATAGRPVRILFSGWALERLGQGRLGEVVLDEAHRDRTEWYCRQLGLDAKDKDMEPTLLSIKALGDVRVFACSASCALFGLTIDRLRPWVDEIAGTTHFMLEELAEGPVLYL